jgi:hypothetical protein
MNWQRRILTATLVLIGLTAKSPIPPPRLPHRITRFGHAGDAMAAGGGADPRAHSLA